MHNKLFEEEKVKKSFYTNGKVSIKLGPDETPPEGFWKGRTFNVNTWNKGKTAKEDSRIATNAANMAKTRKENGSYENPWNKDKTKETDPKKLETFRKNKLNFRIIYPNDLIIEK